MSISMDDRIRSKAAALENSRQHTTSRLQQAIRSFKGNSQQLFLTSTSPKVVQRLCRYGLLDLEDCVELLSQRSESDLNTLWASLAGPKDKNYFPPDNNGDNHNKAKKILRKINSSPPPPSLPLWDRSWTRSLFAASRTTDQVARDLVQQTNSVLRMVPFQEYQRHFCGSESVVINEVLSYISAVQREFCNHLCTGDAAKCVIEDITANSAVQCSLARWPVVSSLSNPKGDLDPSEALLCVEDTIREVLLNTNLSHKLQLKNLELLDRLYQAAANGQCEWQNSFDFPRQALLALKSKEDLAKAIQGNYFYNGGQNEDKGTTSHSVYSSSTLSIVRPNPSADWLSLLKSRANEARDFLETARDRDRDLINRYLPSLCCGSVNVPPQLATELRWTPPDGLHKEHTARIIASRFSKAIRSIPFTEFVRAGCGFRSEQIENLYTLAEGIYRRYQSSTLLQEEYSGVESVLAHRYPLLYNLISTAPNPHSFESIFASIQDLLARDDLSVTNVFRRFAVLSIRYEDARSPEKVESWDGQLSSEFTFLDEISSAPPLVIVNSMTDRHSALFAALKEDDYPSSDRLQFITDTWDRLSKNIKECALADHALVNKLARIEIDFLRLRNFFGGSAIHLALASAGIHPKKTQLFNNMFDSKNDFRYYLQRWQIAPALPFLLPHINGRNGERDRQDFFMVRGYAKWRSGHNEEDLAVYLSQDIGTLSLLSMALLSQLRQLLLCFPLSSRKRNQSHLDLEKGLPRSTREGDTPPTSGGYRAGLLAANGVEPAPSVEYEPNSDLGAEIDCDHSKKRVCPSQVTSIKAAFHQKRILHGQWVTATSIPQLGLAYLWSVLPSLCLCGMLSNKPRSGLDERTHLLGSTCAERATTLCRTDTLTSLNARPVVDSVGCDTISMLESTPHIVASPQDSNILRSSLYSCVICETELIPPPPDYIVLVLMQGSPKMRRALAQIRLPEWDETWTAVASSIKGQYRASNLDKPINDIQQFDPDLPDLPIMDLNWSPPRPYYNKRAIAAIIDETLYFPFRLIPFAVFRDAAAYGHYTDLFMDVLNGITHVYNELCKLFIEYPEQRGVYEEAKTMMQFPVSITVVSNSLMNLSNVPPPIDALHFIFDPIEKVCQNPLLTCASKLKYFGALEISYGKLRDGRHESRWWGLSQVPLDVEHISLMAMSREIMRTRIRFSETSNDVIKTFRTWGPGEAAAVILQVKRNYTIAAAQRAVRLSQQGASSQREDILGEV